MLNVNLKLNIRSKVADQKFNLRSRHKIPNPTKSEKLDSSMIHRLRELLQACKTRWGEASKPRYLVEFIRRTFSSINRQTFRETSPSVFSERNISRNDDDSFASGRGTRIYQRFESSRVVLP